MTEVISFCCLSGANVDARNSYGLTSLHLSVCNGRYGCVLALIKGGADINATSRYYYFCISKGFSKLTLIIVKNDFKPCTYLLFLRFGCTPLHQAAYFNRTKCCQCLLNAGALVNVQESWGRTPLFLAIEKRNM